MELLERDAELSALEQAVGAADRGRGSVVLVTGEPGIGKSALVREFTARVGDRASALVGCCDELISPRPLSALRDLADEVSSPLSSALRGGVPPGVLHSLLVRELRTGGRPTVLVVEDVQWADQATLDALTIVGRRVPELPAVLILTFRPGELGPTHPLLTTVESLQRATAAHLELSALSRRAVRGLAGDATARVYQMTGGNPLLVTQILQEEDELPPSLSTMVLGRVARLPDASRELLELVSVVPGRVQTAVLDLAEPTWPAAAEPAERSQLISSDADHVWFRQEVSRRAVHSNLPPVARRRLHGRVLTALQQLDADPAELVHQAAGAGADEIAGEHALPAAHQARAVGSNREAYAHLQRAAAFADRLDLRQRARLWEDLADSAYLVGRTDVALEAASSSVNAHFEAGQPHEAARCLSTRAHLHWMLGNGSQARRDARNAARRLGAGAPEATRAQAWLRLAELSALASRRRESTRWANRALHLAHEDAEVRARALITLGTMRLQLDPDDTATMDQALECCRAARLHHHTLLVRTAFGFVNLQWVRPDEALRQVHRGRAEARVHEIDTISRYLDGTSAWLHLRAGRTSEATVLARQVSSQGTGPATVADLQARTVMAELSLRHGSDDVDDVLSELADDVDRTRELQRIQPVLELQVEHALLRGAPMPVDRFRQVRRIVGSEPLRAGGLAGRFWAYAALCRMPSDFTGRSSSPHAAMRMHDWRGAADAFGDVGWWYDRAMLLSVEGSMEALREAMTIARDLGAPRLEEHLSRRLQGNGRPVPRGPARSTRANPAGLTDRQVEVLGLLQAGLTNAEIAARLQLSVRTVEHHLSDAYAKLEVSGRVEAVIRCADLGLPAADGAPVRF